MEKTPMKNFQTSLVVALSVMTGAVSAQAPQAKPSNPAATAQQGQMDHSKMGMAGNKPMDHSKMDMSGKKPVDHAKMAANEFAALDKNKDGKLSAAEVPAKSSIKPHFAMLDANKDGTLSKAEHARHHGK
jgi:uncharacterized protein involved in copper resistance